MLARRGLTLIQRDVRRLHHLKAGRRNNLPTITTTTNCQSPPRTPKLHIFLPLTRNGNLPFLHENVLLSSNASTRFGASTINLSTSQKTNKKTTTKLVSSLQIDNHLSSHKTLTATSHSHSLLDAGTMATWASRTSSCNKRNKSTADRHLSVIRLPTSQAFKCPHALVVDVLATAVQVAALPLALVVSYASVQFA